jgi:uncharacterized membrane protein (UPF0127 family)
MRRRLLLGLLLGWALAAPFAARAQSDGPQPELPKERIAIVLRDGARHEFLVEMALTPEQQRVGLMNRPTVPADGGMLFDWGDERPSSMWMKNTIASLDMLFVGQDGRVRSIAERTVPQSLAIVSSKAPVRATIELAAGTAERLGIRVGDRVLHKMFGAAP